jgi:thymidylate synthase (FAD)
MTEKIYTEDKIGYVELVNHTGTDLDIVNAARVSLQSESDWKVSGEKSGAGILSEKDAGLINFLMREKHGTPFEMGFMAQFRIKMPLFVAREHQRHRIGHSINELSGRYAKLEPEFYFPSQIRKQIGKPGAYDFEAIKDQELYEEFDIQLKENCHEAYKAYLKFLEKGVAKEQARMFLPVNLYTEMRWTVNARSLMNYLTLRNSKDAQHEIKIYAVAMEEIFAKYVPETYAAYIRNGRQAP